MRQHLYKSISMRMQSRSEVHMFPLLSENKWKWIQMDMKEKHTPMEQNRTGWHEVNPLLILNVCPLTWGTNRPWLQPTVGYAGRSWKQWSLLCNWDCLIDTEIEIYTTDTAGSQWANNNMLQTCSYHLWLPLSDNNYPNTFPKWSWFKNIQTNLKINVSGSACIAVVDIHIRQMLSGSYRQRAPYWCLDSMM